MDKTLEVINELEKRRIVRKYAIGGGIAAIFYMEPVMTYDLDIFYIPENETNGLVLLSPIYEYLENIGYSLDKEHVIIEGIPVQFIPVYNELIREAVETANEYKYKKVKTRIVRAEHLVAIMLQTYRPKDRERLAKFLEETEIDVDLLIDILTRHGLKEKFDNLRRPGHEKQ